MKEMTEEEIKAEEARMEAEYEKSTPEAIKKALTSLVGKSQEERAAGIAEVIELLKARLEDPYFNENRREAEEYVDALLRGFSAMFPGPQKAKPKPDAKGESIKFHLVGRPYRVPRDGKTGTRHFYLAFLSREGKEPELCVLASENQGGDDEALEAFIDWHNYNDHVSPGSTGGPLWEGTVGEWKEDCDIVYFPEANPYHRTMFATLSSAKALGKVPFTEGQIGFLKGSDLRGFLDAFVKKIAPGSLK